jgi:small subunit ribosomal protein S20
MANTKSAKKAARQAVRRTAVNKARRSRVRTAVRKVEEAAAAMAEAEPAIIRAAQKNIMHRNAARRKVSRLAHRIAKLAK